MTDEKEREELFSWCAGPSLPVAAEGWVEDTVGGLVRAKAEEAGDAACILSAGGEVLTWRMLLGQVEHTRTALRARGVGADDRVAVVMANGPMLAVAFLATAAVSACAPLNPTYREDEFAFYFEDLKARALLVSADAPAAAVAAAHRVGLPLLEAVPDDTAPGLFDLRGAAVAGAAADDETYSDHIALLLHTSGTTSRPKLVPLRHSNLTTSARNIAHALELSSTDRCLDLMPLFHIHGLVGGLLAPLAAGGSVVCPPAFRQDAFFDWLAATGPTWYTAVPTMHRAIVTESVGKDIAGCRLRFVRSSSSPLSASLFDALSRTFGVPILEAYSMTEAAHQMTCNPPQPGRQKPGTVGVPVGPEVTLLDAQGHILSDGEIGEIAIRGPSVMTGYLDNPAANADAFVDGWFRTGDEGRFDEDGYLILTGRIKEQINRGGEKISPFEIDKALLHHPEVVDAVAFGFPHPTLGEEVAAAAVLRAQSEVSADDLKSFVRASVASFKMPKRILMLDKIPKGPTGKVQRRLMANLLGMDGAEPTQAQGLAVPTSRLEAEVLVIWRRVIGRESLGVNDDFFESGGDSLMAFEILLGLEELMGRSVPESILLEHPTVRRLVVWLLQAEGDRESPIIAIQPNGSRPPIFFFHGDQGGGYYARNIARLLGPDQPLLSIDPHSIKQGKCSIEDMAADRLPILLAAHPSGPFRLAGYCNGGMVAFEVARRLTEMGRDVDFLALIDTPPLNFRPAMRGILRPAGSNGSGLGRSDGGALLASLADLAWRQLCNLRESSFSTYAEGVVEALSRRVRGGLGSLPAKGTEVAVPNHRVRDEMAKRGLLDSKLYNHALRMYLPEPMDLPIVYYSAIYRRTALRHLGPRAEFVPVPGGHWGCITTHAEVLVADWRSRLDQSEPPQPKAD